MSDWRTRLSDPPKPHTLPELMMMVLDMASEDAATAEADYSPSAEYLSARAEFKARVGYDLYDELRSLLRSPLFEGQDYMGEPTLPNDAKKLEGVDTERIGKNHVEP